MRDDIGNQLGGKKAALQFVHESVFGKSRGVEKKTMDVKAEGGNIKEEDSSLEDIWKLSEELKALEAALESLQVKELNLEQNAEDIYELDPGTENENLLPDEDEEVNDVEIDDVKEKDKRVNDEKQPETFHDTVGKSLSDTGVIEQKYRTENAGEKVRSRIRPSPSQEGKTGNPEKGSLTRSLTRSPVRLTEKGARGKRKALAGLRDEI